MADYKRQEEVDSKGKEAKGKKLLLKHLTGERLTTKQMAVAKCYDCTGYYADGKVDCKCPNCPLYPVMPYREGEKYSVRPTAGVNREMAVQKMLMARTKKKGISKPEAKRGQSGK